MTPRGSAFTITSSLAMTPERLALGVVDAKIWARDPVEFEKDADQKRAERRAKPIEDKESIRWIEGYRAVCQVAQEASGTHIVSLADSEARHLRVDLGRTSRRGSPQGVVHHSSLSESRLGGARRGSVRRQSHNHLREQVASTPVLAQRTIEVRRRDPKSKDDRKRKQPREARTAEVAIRATRVTLRGPYRPGGKLADVEVNVVLVSELNPPPGVEADRMDPADRPADRHRR